MSELFTMNEQIKKCAVHMNKSLMDGMRAITNGRVGIALVINDKCQLFGTLTDGDIRRALLDGATMDSLIKPVANQNFTTASPEATRTQVLDLMQARRIHQVPIVDNNGQLVGLHLLHEIIGGQNLPNWAVVMAGGKGERLRPITNAVPKPMIKVAGRPILERIILHLVGFGIKRVFISINYLGHIIENYFGSGHQFGCKIEYLREDKFLGTGGALSLLPEKPKDPLIMMNGDLVTQVNINHMLHFHEKGKYAATIGVKNYLHQIPYGCVKTNDNQIIEFEEKPILEKLVNTGIYILSPELISRVENHFFPITDLFTDCLECNNAIGAFKIEEDWIDVGQHAQLNFARNGHSNKNF